MACYGPNGPESGRSWPINTQQKADFSFGDKKNLGCKLSRGSSRGLDDKPGVGGANKRKCRDECRIRAELGVVSRDGVRGRRFSEDKTRAACRAGLGVRGKNLDFIEFGSAGAKAPVRFEAVLDEPRPRWRVNAQHAQGAKGVKTDAWIKFKYMYEP